MSSNRSNKNYTARDIEEYLNGRLTHSQMHEMEKAALDDPFLAEAIEGYEGMKEKNWNSTLAAIRREVEQSGSEAKIIPMHRSRGKWWKTAAAIFLVGGGTILTYILTKDNGGTKGSEQISQNIPPVTDTVKAKDNTALVPPVKTEQPVISPLKQPNNVASGTIAQVDPSKLKDETVFQQDRKRSPDPIINNGRVLADSIGSFANSTLSAPPPPANYNTGQAKEAANLKDRDFVKQNNIADKKELSLNHSFVAQVVAPDNSPLPFSNVSVKNENFGTYADVKGNFRLVSADSFVTIEVKSVGYLPRTFTLRSDLPQNKIVLLEDDVALRGKAVVQDKDVSSTRKPRRATLMVDSLVNAEPADGWENYNTYIANNIDIPENILKNGLHGEVGISFDIKADGAITNIRVDKSLGNDYDEAAKRLILHGPQWKVKKGKKTSARIKVQF